MRTNCPNCGAPLNSMGKCDYCGTVVSFNHELIPIIIENKKAISLQGASYVSSEVVANLGAEEATKMCLNQIAKQMTEQIIPVMEYVTFNDPCNNMQCVKGMIRVLEKEYRF